MGTRSDGFYWVECRRCGWTIAKWNQAQGWWILGWLDMSDPAYPSGVCTDARFLHVGKRVYWEEDIE